MNYRRILKKSLSLAQILIVAVAALMVSGVPSTAVVLAGDEKQADSKALQALLATMLVGKNDVTPPMNELRQALLDAQVRGAPDNSRLGPPLKKALGALQRLRDSIQSTAETFTEKDEKLAEPFLGVLIAYYSSKGLLHVAFEALIDHSAGADKKDLAALDLILPAKLARMVIDLQSQQALAQGGEAYDLSFNVTDAGVGKKKLSINPLEAARYRMGAFMAFPSDVVAKRALVFQSLKLAMTRQAMLNSYLYSDERVHLSLPQGTDPSIGAIQSHANAIAHESVYRRYITAALVKQIADAVGAKSKNFKEEARKMLRSIALGLYDRMDMETIAPHVPKAVAERMNDQKEGDKAFLEAVDHVADKFTIMVEQQRIDAIQAALKASPIYLTQMSREDLRAAIAQAVEVTIVSLSFVPIQDALLGMKVDSLEVKEQALIYSHIAQFLKKVFKAEMVTDEVLAEFEKSRWDFDLMVSFRRYELASKVLTAVEWIEGAERILQQMVGFEIVPSSLLPKKPDPGMTLLAMKHGADAPLWTVEMLQSVGGKVRTVSDVTTLRAAEGLVRSTPSHMLKSAEEIRRLANPGVLAEISALHEARKEIPAYKWRSLDEKIRILGKRASSQNSRKLLLSFLNIDKLATKAGVGALKPMIRKAFNGLFDAKELGVLEKKFDGIDELIDALSKGVVFVKQNHDFIQNVFSEPKLRNQYLRKILSHAPTYRDYIQVHIQDLQTQLPMVFTSLKLSSKAIKESGNPNPVQFSDLVSGLKQAISTSRADLALGKTLLSQLTDERIRQPGILTQPAKAAVTAHNLTVGATSGTRKDPKLSTQIMDAAIDYWTDTKSTPQTSDAYWPNDFLIRDALPAYFDAEAPLETKVRRMAVSALLAPYLRFAAEASRDEVSLLLDPKLDHSKALVQSEAYRMVMLDTGNAVSDGMAELSTKLLKWRKRWETVKRITAKTQEWAHWVFYETLFLEMPVQGHLILNSYMAISSAADFAADVGLLVDYWSSYAGMRPFGQAGVLGKGTIANHEVENLRREMHTMVEIIVNRLPIDIPFYISIGHEWAGAAKQFVHQIRFGKAMEGQNMEEFSIDIQRLGKAYAEIGVDFRISREQFKKLYEQKARELAPKLKKDRKAKAEFDAWVAATKQTNTFFGKYDKVLKAMQQANESEAAPTAEEKKAEGEKARESKKPDSKK